MATTARHRPPGPRPVLGVLGGLGPLASARFLETVYRRHRRPREQDMPAVFLLSDPTVMDRTIAVLRGQEEMLARQVTARLQELLDAGADLLIVACVTAHCVFDRLPDDLLRHTVSLVDQIVEAQRLDPRPRLLLSTTGAVGAGVFERHPGWSSVSASVRRLEDGDQQALHREIYRVKQGESIRRLHEWIGGARRRYGCDGEIYACTELHLLHRLEVEPDPAILDPLILAADCALATLGTNRHPGEARGHIDVPRNVGR